MNAGITIIIVISGVEDEIRLADQGDTSEEEEASQDLGEVETVSEEEGGEGDGNHGTGKDDTERVRYRHVRDTGEGGDEAESSSDS